MKRDKTLHLVLGLMIFMICMGFFQLSAEVAMLIVTVVGIGKELIWDKVLKKGAPEKMDAVATMAGGAIGVSLFALFHLIF
jgi:hypothetical protein